VQKADQHQGDEEWEPAEKVKDFGRMCAAGKVKIPREVPGKIYYEPDTGDDWDDGDPYNDLVSNIQYLILKESSNK
jgi:hypothetical protein